MKTYRTIHIIMNVLAFGVLVFYLIYAVVAWNDIPETIGVHFASGSGEEIADFDIYGSKWFVLFPFVAGFALLGVFSLGGHIANKVKLGLNVDERGDKLTRAAVNLYFDALKLGWGVAFAYWADCVIHQHGMYTIVPIIGVLILFFGMIVLCISLLAIRRNLPVAHRKDMQKEKAEHPERTGELHREIIKDAFAYRIVHTTTNVAAFTSLGGYLAFMLIVWWSLPDTIGVHFGSGNAGLAAFDVYAEKIFAFYPFWAGFGLLLIFSLLQIGVKKVKLGLKIDRLGERKIRSYTCLYLDLHKVVWAGFFSHWADCVIHQSELHTIVPVLGLGLCFVGTMLIIGTVIIVKHRYRVVPEETEAAAEREKQ